MIRSLCNLSFLLEHLVSLPYTCQTCFQKAKNKAYTFRLLTALIPLLLGAVVGLVFAYGIISAIVVCTLLGPYTCSGLPVVSRLGFTRLESIPATVGVNGSGPPQYLWIYLRSVAQPFSQVFPQPPSLCKYLRSRSSYPSF